MLHRAFKVRGHHAERHRGALTTAHVASILIRDVDRAWRVMRIDHATAWQLLLIGLLFYGALAVGRRIVASGAVVRPAVVVVGAVVVMAYHRRTIHNWVLVAHFLYGRKLLQNIMVNGQFHETYIELKLFIRR
jgi:hypothetical protein